MSRTQRSADPATPETVTQGRQYHQVKAHFLDLIDLEPADRHDHLARLEHEAPSLATEARALLAMADAPTGWLRHTVEARDDTIETEAESAPCAHDTSAALLDDWQRFTGLEPIGRGGMGTVFRAFDPRLERTVAIKLLHDAAGPTALRLHREAALQARIDHPHVLDVYETGDVAGQAYIAMRYVDEPSIRAIRPLTSLGERVTLIRQVADALHAAHERGLIHRDVKPGNILVEKTATGWHPYVSDFGIATEAGAPEPAAGPLLGSPRYMAPEQLEQPATLDRRVDVYGLGATFYELLSGTPPFTAPTIVDLVIDIRGRTPRPPPGVPAGLAAIVMRCLEKDPQRRFATAAALADALRAWSSARRRRRLALPALAGILALASAIGTWQHRDGWNESAVDSGGIHGGVPSRATRPVIAVVPLLDHDGDDRTAWLGIALQELLTSRLATGDQLRTIDPGRLAGVAAVTRADPDWLHDLEQTYGADLVLFGAYRTGTRGGDPTLRLDLQLAALRPEVLPEEKPVQVEVVLTEQPLDALAAQVEAQIRQVLGLPEAGSPRPLLPHDPISAQRYAEGLGRLRQHDAAGARALFEQAIERSPTHPHLHLQLSRALHDLGFDQEAEHEARRALELGVALPPLDRLEIEAHRDIVANDWAAAETAYRALWRQRPDEADYGLALARVRTEAGRPRDALATLRALRQGRRASHHDPRVDLAEADALADLADFQASVTAARRAQVAAAASSAPAIVAEARLLESWAWRNLGDLEAADHAAGEARVIAAASGDRRRVASALASRAMVAKLRGDFDLALEHFGEALAIAEARGDRFTVSTVHNNMAVLLADRGLLDQALAHYHQTRTIERALGNPRREAIVEVNIGLIDALRGEHRAALERYRRALATFRRIEHPRGTGLTLAKIAESLIVLGRLGDATRAAEEGLDIATGTGARGEEATHLDLLGWVAREAGRVDEAEAYHGRALALHRDIGNRTEEATSLLHRGAARLLRGHLADAEAAFREAATIAGEVALPDWRARAMLGLAEIALLRGHLDRAARRLDEVSRLTRRAGRVAESFRAQMMRVRIAHARGDHARAIEVATAARDRADTRRYADRAAEAGAHLATSQWSAGNVERARAAALRARREAQQGERVPLQIAIGLRTARLAPIEGTSADVTKRIVALGRQATTLGLHVLALEAGMLHASLRRERGETAGIADLQAAIDEANALGLRALVHRVESSFDTGAGAD